MRNSTDLGIHQKSNLWKGWRGGDLGTGCYWTVLISRPQYEPAGSCVLQDGQRRSRVSTDISCLCLGQSGMWRSPETLALRKALVLGKPLLCGSVPQGESPGLQSALSSAQPPNPDLQRVVMTLTLLIPLCVLLGIPLTACNTGLKSVASHITLAAHRNTDVASSD